MLSTTLNHHPARFGSPNMAMHQAQLPAQHMSSGLDSLAESSQYALQQMHRQQQQPPPPPPPHALAGLNGERPPMKHRQSFGAESMNGSLQGEKKTGRSASSGQPVRRRISRACDQCNQLRTKCDGKTPCAHCVEFGLTCEYVRERKKRGKASRKDLAAQQANSGANPDDADGAGDGKDGSPRSHNDQSSDEQSVEPTERQRGVKRRRSSAQFHPPQLPPPPRSGSIGTTDAMHALPSLEQNGTVAILHASDQRVNEQRQPLRTMSMSMDQQTPGMALPTPQLPRMNMSDRNMVGDYGSIDDYHRSMIHPGATVTGHNILHSGTANMPGSIMQGNTMTGYPESQYPVPSPGSQNGMAPTHFRMGESPLSAGFLGQSPVGGSPGWMSLPSPTAALYPHMQHTPMLRFPVLRPILPHIAAIIPVNLACDLLELYFTSTTSAFMQPQSPYILGYVFRKRSFLRSHNPRVCSPALLASMLWVAAQTSESAFLTSPPTARGKICQKLLELTVGLLKPLIHTSSDSAAAAAAYTSTMDVNGVALGGFGVSLPSTVHEMEGGSPGATGALDDVATYIHLATVVSASEYKAASLRWWNAAWTLARELKLGRELPANIDSAPQRDLGDGSGDANGEHDGMNMNGHPPANGAAPRMPGQSSPPGVYSEEEREERRRIWWLLYTVDRHLALCYNRPLFLLDVECDGLLQPEHDGVWQAGEYYPGEGHHESTYFRRRGPTFECTGHSIFGYFLPLMTILGEIADLNHARNHPRFGLRFRNPGDWDDHAIEITQQLEAYGRSLKEFEARFINPPPPGEGKLGGDGQHADVLHHDANTPSVHSVGTNNSAQRATETIVLQTKIVVAYSTHLMHTLHILLNGKWDPISLLDDNDLWISSQGFISATSHAVSAAEAINDILEYDPDLSFMPFFFGIYLLQGSFLLLLIADKLQGEASPSVVKACETIVRAHEACVVTLNTEYQVRERTSPTLNAQSLTTSTEKLPKSHAISPLPSPRQGP
jgi:hypothetical protein